jgi:hypothetical protein
VVLLPSDAVYMWTYSGTCLPDTDILGRYFRLIMFTQYFLRKRVLDGDMSRYVCCQGYVNICCFKAGTMGEESCPDACLCLEACLCNGFAVSASRMYVMDKYELSSDPCDYRLIRVNNCIQVFACICNLVAIFNRDLRHFSRILDHVADLVFHTVSGCMTAQVHLSSRSFAILF